MKLSIGKSEDYTTGSLIDYNFYVNEWNFIAVDLSKQSVLESDPRAIQQIEFIYRLDNNINSQILTVLQKEKETVLEFSKGIVKSLLILNIKWLNTIK